MKTKMERIADPANCYSRPKEVEADNELTRQEKIVLLRNWLDDIQLRQTAEAENMQDTSGARTYIAEVRHLLEKYIQ